MILKFSMLYWIFVVQIGAEKIQLQRLFWCSYFGTKIDEALQNP